MFHFNLTSLKESYNNIQETVSSLTLRSNNTFPYLLSELNETIRETKKELNKLLPATPRRKRGLVNGLGSIIKFISGNLDQDDLDNLQKQLNSLRQSNSKEIKHINKLISFSNSIAQKFYIEMNHVNYNMKVIKGILQQEDFKINLLEHLQYVLLCVNKFDKIIRVLQDTISLSFKEMTNVKMFSQKDITNIVKHLQLIYPTKTIIHNDQYHQFENLKLSKTQVLMMNEEMIVILFVPITNGKTYTLYRVSPIPNKNNLILIPPERYYLQGPTLSWSNAPCERIAQYYACILFNTRRTTCNLTDTTGCQFAIVKNEVELFQPLNKEHILFSSKRPQMILQTCPESQNTLKLMGSYIIYSNVSCPLTSMGITLQQQPTNYVHPFPLLSISDEPHVKTEINFLPSHLNVNGMKLDLKPIPENNTKVKTFVSMNIIITIIIFGIILLIFRNKIFQCINSLKGKFKVKIIEDDNAQQRMEELCIPHGLEPQNPF